MPSATHFPLFFLHGNPGKSHASVSGKYISCLHLIVSKVPIKQPKGPQQIWDPKHFPESPGPQEMHYNK